MKNFLKVFCKNNDSPNIVKKVVILNKPGDRLEARITNSNRKVIKLLCGNTKYSVTQYPTGTVVETKVIRKN